MEKNQKNKSRIRFVWIHDLKEEKQIEQIIREIVDFDLADNTGPICLLINSIGGRFSYMNEIRDLLLQNISSPLITVALSRVQSAACALMQCGHIRIALKQSEFLFHKTRNGYFSTEPFELTQEDLKNSRKGLKKSTRVFLKRLTIPRPEHINPCKIKPKKLLKLIEQSSDKDLIINSETALAMGFVDCVIEKINQVNDVVKEFMKTFTAAENGETKK